MTDADNHPVARLQSLMDGWPEIGIEVTGGHSAQGLVLDRNLPSVEEVAGEVSPFPLSIVSVAHRTVTHRRVAYQEKHGVLALSGRAGGRTVHQGLGDRVGCVVYDFLLNGCREIVEALCSHLQGCKDK